MYSFVFLVLFVLTLKPLVIRSDFCTKYKSLTDNMNQIKPGSKHIQNLKFIVTKDAYYLYLGAVNNGLNFTGEFVYELDVSCTSPKKCPHIGSEKQFSQVFQGMSGLKSAFIQDGITYLFTESPPKVSRFDNKKLINSTDEKDLWKHVHHSTVYEWKDNTKTVISRFIPPKSPPGPPRFGFSFDTYNGKITVELQGDYEMVNIVKHIDAKDGMPALTLYSFGHYLVATKTHAYLPLPNGDAILNIEPPVYVRNSGSNLYLYRGQNLYKMFGCDNATLKDKILTDTRSDNVYPSYFTNLNS